MIEDASMENSPDGYDKRATPTMTMNVVVIVRTAYVVEDFKSAANPCSRSRV